MTRLTQDIINDLKATDLVGNSLGIDLDLPDGRGVVIGYSRKQRKGVKLTRYTIDHYTDTDQWERCESHAKLDHLKAALLGLLDAVAFIMQIDGTIDAVKGTGQMSDLWRGQYTVKQPALGEPWFETLHHYHTENEALVAAAEARHEATSK
jgi:hypothetical protein